MKTWVLWVLTLNTQTGAIVAQAPEPSYEPTTVEQCLKDQTSRISHAKDGKVQIYECRVTN